MIRQGRIRLIFTLARLRADFGEEGGRGPTNGLGLQTRQQRINGPRKIDSP